MCGVGVCSLTSLQLIDEMERLSIEADVFTYGAVVVVVVVMVIVKLHTHTNETRTLVCWRSCVHVPMLVQLHPLVRSLHVGSSLRPSL